MNRAVVSQRKSVVALTKGKWKLMQNNATGEVKLYDLDEDYAEERDVAPECEGIVASLQEEIATFYRTVEERKGQLPQRDDEGTMRVDRGAFEQLKALGYVQ